MAKSARRRRRFPWRQRLYLRSPEAAEILGVSLRRVQYWIADGTLASERVGLRSRRIPVEAVVEFRARLVEEGE